MHTTARLFFMGCCTAVASTPCMATDDLQEVVVTAQKQPYRGDLPLTQLPQSVAVVDGNLLQQAGITSLQDSLDFASGIVRQNSFGNLWDSFAIRGFAGDENLPSIYLVNGFSAGRGFSGRRDSINVERMEVFKGPGSSLIGRSDPGGTVNVVTKKPQFESQGSVELSAGSFSTYRVAGDYTTPLADRVAVRINGAYEDAESFRDTVESRKTMLSPSVLVNLSDSASLSYEAELLKQQAPFDRGVVAINNQLGRVPSSRFYGEPNDGPITIAATGHQLTYQQSLARDWSLLVGLGYRDSSFEGYSSDAELAANRQSLYFATTNVLARQRRYRDYDATDLSGRVEATGQFATGAVAHHVLLGVDAYDYALDQLQNRFRVGAGQSNPTYGIDVFNPVYGQAQPVPTALTNTLEDQHSQGIYVQDQVELNEQWQLQAGLRLDRYTQEILNRFSSSTARQDDSAINPRLAVQYQFSTSLALYANYAAGFRPNTGSDAAGQPFKAERSHSYEAGVKWGSGQSWQATLASYLMTKNNFLTADPVNSGFSLAMGEARSIGVELDVAARFATGTALTFNYAHVNASTTKDSLEYNFSRAVPKGSELINVPKHSGNLWLTQTLMQQRWVLGAGLNHVGSRLGETGVPAFRLPQYTLVNAMLEYHPASPLTVAVHVRNVFDREYYPSSYARVWVAAGAPRSVTASVRYTF